MELRALSDNAYDWNFILRDETQRYLIHLVILNHFEPIELLKLIEQQSLHQ